MSATFSLGGIMAKSRQTVLGAALAFVIITDINNVKEVMHPPRSILRAGASDNIFRSDKLWC